MENILQDLIIENQSRIQGQEIIPRHAIFDYQVFDLNKIVSIVGPRRAGKTYFMYQIAQNLLSTEQIVSEQIVFIDFSEYRGQDFDFTALLASYFELFPHLTPWFFFDEIQEIAEFRTGVLMLYNRGYKIVMSGSNSNLLSRELSTHFGGRSLETYIYPLSFAEFLDFRGYIRYPHMTLQQTGYLKNLFHEYLQYGGYPEVVIANTPGLKTTLLSNYFDIIVYRDLKERYSIQNDIALRYLLKRAILSDTKDYNVNKLSRDLQSQGVEVSKNTLYTYLEYCRNIFFLATLHNQYAMKGASKIFLISWGFLALHGAADLGQRFENMVYMDLVRYTEQLYFLRGVTGEIDFYLPDRDVSIQACYLLTRDNIARELDPLIHRTGRRYCIVSEIDIGLQIPSEYASIEIVRYLDWTGIA